MGAGGIIQQQVTVMLGALRDPCIWENLPRHCKDIVQMVEGKPTLERSVDDRDLLAEVFKEIC